MSIERRMRRDRRRTRRFTVEMGEGRALKILAADEHTKTWAVANQWVLTVALRTLASDIETKKLAGESLGAIAAEDIETPKTVAARFGALLQSAYPEETFDVRAELQ